MAHFNSVVVPINNNFKSSIYNSTNLIISTNYISVIIPIGNFRMNIYNMSNFFIPLCFLSVCNDNILTLDTSSR